MKKLYVTYLENNTLKKAVINEQRYQVLKSTGSVSDVVVYPTESLMEQNYSVQCSKGSCGGGKSMLHG